MEKGIVFGFMTHLGKRSTARCEISTWELAIVSFLRMMSQGDHPSTSLMIFTRRLSEWEIATQSHVLLYEETNAILNQSDKFREKKARDMRNLKVVHSLRHQRRQQRMWKKHLSVCVIWCCLTDMEIRMIMTMGKQVARKTEANALYVDTWVESGQKGYHLDSIMKRRNCNYHKENASKASNTTLVLPSLLVFSCSSKPFWTRMI